MAKRRFETWAFAEEAHDRESKKAGVLQMALTDLCLGKAEWISGTSENGAALSRLDAPHGGIIILVDHGIADAYYVDDWMGMVQKMAAPGFSDPESTKAWTDLRNLMDEVRHRQNVVHERLMAEARR